MILGWRGVDPSESVALARLGCDVRGDGRTAEVCHAVRELIDLSERHRDPPPEGRPIADQALVLVMALYVARTPDAPLP